MDTSQNYLLDQVAAPENLLSAWRAVRGNIPRYRRSRTSGPDGVSLAEFERDLPAQIEALADMLLKGRYKPQPPSHFFIKKKDGTQRKLSILTVRDRVAQRAAQQVLEPIWEPLFLDCSYGYRPGISINHAVSCVQRQWESGNTWVVDGDIEACFDRLDHDILMKRLRMHISDRRVLELMQNWLDAGSVQAGLPVNDLESEFAESQGEVSPIKQGLTWILDNVTRELDPYYRRYPDYNYPGDSPESDTPHRDTIVKTMRQEALQQAAVSSLLWGANWLKPGLIRLGKTAQVALNSPAGRRWLRQSAFASAGVAGLAAVGAVTAYALHQKMGPVPAGVLQGSPLSPLLANIYLHPFDQAMIRAQHHLIRFADDWLICCPNLEKAEQAYNDALRFLSQLHLKVNPNKTRILEPGNPLEWLGKQIK